VLAAASAQASTAIPGIKWSHLVNLNGPVIAEYKFEKCLQGNIRHHLKNSPTFQTEIITHALKLTSAIAKKKTDSSEVRMSEFLLGSSSSAISGLETGCSPIQRALPTVYKRAKLKEAARTQIWLQDH
jgi:hypothetical protein